MYVTLSGIDKDDKAVHPLNAPASIFVTLCGMFTLVNPLELNAPTSIVLTELGIKIVFRLVQRLNVPGPIVIRVLGRETLVKFVNSSNLELPVSVIPLCITIFLTFKYIEGSSP